MKSRIKEKWRVVRSLRDPFSRLPSDGCKKNDRNHFAPRAVTVVRATSSLYRAIIPGIRNLSWKSLASGIVCNRTPTRCVEISPPFNRDIRPRLAPAVDFYRLLFSFIYSSRMGACCLRRREKLLRVARILKSFIKRGLIRGR